MVHLLLYFKEIDKKKERRNKNETIFDFIQRLRPVIRSVRGCQCFRTRHHLSSRTSYNAPSWTWADWIDRSEEKV